MPFAEFLFDTPAGSLFWFIVEVVLFGSVLGMLIWMSFRLGLFRRKDR